MKISISSPFPADSLQGNSVSGRRIAGLLRVAGHDVELFQDGFAPDCHLLIALNAWRSADVISDFYSRVPCTLPEGTGYPAKIIVVMTGSDLYPFDGVLKAETLQSINFADAIVMTQGEAREKINHPLIREIRKSIELPDGIADRKKDNFSTCRGVIVAHLREQKNPFLYLRAIPSLKNQVRIEHYGNANSAEYRESAIKYKSEAYQWMGEVPRLQLLAELKSADFLLNTSYIEGSSNAIYESIALATPVIASAIPGNIGVLGKDYPGLFRADDSESLAAVLDKFSESSDFRDELNERCSLLANDLSTDKERDSWCELIAEIESGTT